MYEAGNYFDMNVILTIVNLRSKIKLCKNTLSERRKGEKKFMKKTMKKLVVLVAIFAMLITAIPVSAANDAATHTWVTDKLVGYVPVKSDAKQLSLATTKAKNVSVKVANPKIGKIVYEDLTFMKLIHFVPKRAGKTVVTTKVGKKTFKTNVTVYKYTDPISSVKVGDTTISGSKFAKTDRIYLDYDKYAGKTINLKFNTKKDWYCCYIELKDKDGNDIPNLIKQKEGGSFKGVYVHGGKGNFICNIVFENMKNKGVETLSIVFK